MACSYNKSVREIRLFTLVHTIKCAAPDYIALVHNIKCTAPDYIAFNIKKPLCNPLTPKLSKSTMQNITTVEAVGDKTKY